MLLKILSDINLILTFWFIKVEYYFEEPLRKVQIPLLKSVSTIKSYLFINISQKIIFFLVGLTERYNCTLFSKIRVVTNNIQPFDIAFYLRANLFCAIQPTYPNSSSSCPRTAILYFRIDCHITFHKYNNQYFLGVPKHTDN